jgi:hypothetical protein
MNDPTQLSIYKEELRAIRKGVSPMGANLGLIYGLLKVGNGCLNGFKTAENQFKLTLMDGCPSSPNPQTPKKTNKCVSVVLGEVQFFSAIMFQA